MAGGREQFTLVGALHPARFQVEIYPCIICAKKKAELNKHGVFFGGYVLLLQPEAVVDVCLEIIGSRGYVLSSAAR